MASLGAANPLPVGVAHFRPAGIIWPSLSGGRAIIFLGPIGRCRHCRRRPLIGQYEMRVGRPAISWPAELTSSADDKFPLDLAAVVLFGWELSSAAAAALSAARRRRGRDGICTRRLVTHPAAPNEDPPRRWPAGSRNLLRPTGRRPSAVRRRRLSNGHRPVCLNWSPSSGA